MTKLTRYSNFIDLKEEETPTIRVQKISPQSEKQLKAFIELLRDSILEKPNSIKTQTQING